MTDTIVLTAFVYVFRRDREHARGVLQHGDFLEIYCRCPPEVCETRDPKGRYARARAGEIKEFTGVAAPYEKRVDPELILDSAVLPVEDSVRRVCALLDDRAVISRRRGG
jgi:adenylylsulfate kinase